MIKYYLFDIEGTTTDIAFVHKVLFPYSYEKISSFVLHNQHLYEVQEALKQTFELVQQEQGKRLGLYNLIDTLKFWITTDRKIMPLKTLQGLLWDQGYESGTFKGHVYPDVKPYWEELKNKNLGIGIYSSGSVHAQKQLFKYSCDGDLTPYLGHHFDTKVGGKKEVTSYQRIAAELKLRPEEIMFYSDIGDELQAAKLAGLNVCQLLRPGIKKDSRFESRFHF